MTWACVRHCKVAQGPQVAPCGPLDLPLYRRHEFHLTNLLARRSSSSRTILSLCPRVAVGLPANTDMIGSCCNSSWSLRPQQALLSLGVDKFVEYGHAIGLGPK